MRASMIRLSLAVAALLLCGASITYTVLLCLTFADTTPMRLLAASTGFALELVKFSLFPVGVALWQHRQRLAALSCFSLGTVLVSVSFLASVSFFDEAAAAKASAALAGSTRYQVQQAQLEAIGKRIVLLQESAARDIEHGYRARANDTLESLEEVEQERKQLVTQLAAKPGNTGKPVAPGLVYSILAALIEVCAVAALVLPGKYLLADRNRDFRSPSRARETYEKTARLGQELNNLSHTQEQTENRSKQPAAPTPITTDLAQALQSGTVQPSYRAIARYLRCRHAKAKEAAQGLIQKGVLRSSGSGLQLA